MADNRKKNQQTVTRQNILETLKDLGTGTGVQTKDFVKNTSEDFLRELLGLSVKNVKRSGELTPGKSIQMGDVMSGKEEELVKERVQINFERRILNEEKQASQEKKEELKVELQAIMQEVKKVSESTEGLALATEAAIISAPVEPGIYHINFFTNLLEFLQSFRKKIDLAATWLQFSNKRAEKKNYWSTYKKKGSSFLLSPDHYSQRSAG